MVDVADWYVRFSEPTRVRPRRHLEQFNRNAAWFGITTSPFLRDWYRPLSEPVWVKIPPPRGSWPFFFSVISYVEYTLSFTELGDTISLSLTTLTKKNLARVTITEIETYQDGVTIKEIVQGREYS